jgi:hypothetical protein
MLRSTTLRVTWMPATTTRCCVRAPSRSRPRRAPAVVARRPNVLPTRAADRGMRRRVAGFADQASAPVRTATVLPAWCAWSAWRHAPVAASPAAPARHAAPTPAARRGSAANRTASARRCPARRATFAATDSCAHPLECLQIHMAARWRTATRTSWAVQRAFAASPACPRRDRADASPSRAQRGSPARSTASATRIQVTRTAVSPRPAPKTELAAAAHASRVPARTSSSCVPHRPFRDAGIAEAEPRRRLAEPRTPRPLS